MQIDMRNGLCQFKTECVYDCVAFLYVCKDERMSFALLKYSEKISYYKPLPEGNLVKS